MDSVTDDGFLCRRVSPFGNLRIDAYVPLPGTYRSLSRPSSAPDAKAFPLRSFSLNLLVLKNYAGSIGSSRLSKLLPIVFHNLLQTLPSVALLVLYSLFSFQCADENTAFSDTVPSKLNNAKSERTSCLTRKSGLPRQTIDSLERR